MNNIEIPRIRKTTWRTDAGGGVLIVAGGATNDAVAVTIAAAVDPGATLLGVTAHDDTFMVLAVHDNVTGSVRPPIPLTVIGIEPATPLVKLAVVGTVKLKSAVVEPVPVSETVNIFGAVPICSVAASAPAGNSVGVKTTSIVHEAPAASVPVQPVAAPEVAVKSPAFAPMTANGIVSVPDELFVSVTVIGGADVTFRS